MLLSIDDPIDDVSNSGDSGGYTEARAAVTSRRSRGGKLGKRKNMPVQEASGGSVVRKRSRKGERLDRDDQLLIGGKDTARRLFVLSKQERGGMHQKKTKKLVEFVAEKID